MIKSMTGFGRSEYQENGLTVQSEIKSVNHRYCDISVKLPRKYSFCEDAIKNIVKKYVSRGKIEVNLAVNDESFNEGNISLNIEAGKAYFNALRKLNEEILDGTGTISLSMLSSNPDILKTVVDENDEEKTQEVICKAVEESCVKYNEMRETEGNKLAEDLLKRGKFVKSTTEEIESYAPEVKKMFFEKMKTRISELLDGSVEIPEDRILVEAAVYADKVDVTEEITRLKSHCNQLENFLTKSNEPIGKKLDFLVQEMNRESNTIGSKCNDIAITEKVLSLKNEIEKIREQIQNIE